ncbi:MAG TPA: proteasome subunit alpha, partial [Candidatus Binatia bacterium]|nr:proteasome subunit alpha [Candidatus Binatia bacterium]
MNGDFLALLPKPSFPQLGPNASVVAPLQATTVFAFHCSEGVVIAGDHRATAGNLVFSDKTEKILELDSHSLMAIAGVPATAFEMARTLQTTFEFYRRSQLQSMSLPAKIRALSQLLRNNLPATIQGFGIVSPIFAGVETNEPDARPQIYFYDPLGAQFEATNFAGSGSGSGSIKSVLSFLERWGCPKPAEMSLAQATNLANRLLMTAAEFDTATGGVHPDRRQFATLKLIARRGIRSISTDEQDHFWKAT